MWQNPSLIKTTNMKEWAEGKLAKAHGNIIHAEKVWGWFF